jgi:hypothetical protein
MAHRKIALWGVFFFLLIFIIAALSFVLLSKNESDKGFIMAGINSTSVNEKRLDPHKLPSYFA